MMKINYKSFKIIKIKLSWTMSMFPFFFPKRLLPWKGRLQTGRGTVATWAHRPAAHDVVLSVKC